MRKAVRFITPTRAEVRAEHAYYREWLMAQELRAGRFRLNMGFNDGRPVGSNRCHIVKSFLATDADVLVMLDGDSVPTCNVLNYIGCGFDVVGFAYPTWRGNDANPMTWFPREPQPGETIVPVEAVGGGCLIIDRKVLERPEMRAPFVDEFDDRGICVEGEDLMFCEMARAAGFSIGCVMDKPIAHFKTIELLTLYRWLAGREA